ncbi:outer membrane beta-barrel protein [Vibrio sinaloensis]|uniref:outer membrane beta-barrel protein n=1 Tax=Photobacterium sp. (strain ATCC 43367) TaxID=379097 RepID=UPI0022AE55AB|nr:outer membrane beta-barrel protein [Vibrio sinaloensis]MCZ4293047.1 outer membrane beta-barrel protein [Vibrio sinaloensis]
MLKKTVLALALIGASTVANANPYLGVSVGQAKFKDTYSSYDSSVFGNGSFKLDLEDDSSTAAKVFAGYEFNQYFAIEGSIGGYDALNGSYVSVGDMMFLATQAKGMLPIGERFNLFVKGGLAYFGAEFKTSFATVSDEVVTGMYGVGAEFAISKNVKLSAELDYMRPELEVIKIGTESVSIESDITTLSLGLSYHF